MSTCHYSFPKHFFIMFCILSEFVKVFERKVRHVLAAHLHNAGRALSSPSLCFQYVVRTNIYFVILDIVVKENRMWFSVVCALIDNDTCHHTQWSKLSYITKRALCFS